MTLALVSLFMRTVAVGLICQALLVGFQRRAAATRHLIVAAGLMAVLSICLVSGITGNRAPQTFTTTVETTTLVDGGSAGHELRSAITPNGIEPTRSSSFSVLESVSSIWAVGTVILLVRLVVCLGLLRRQVSRVRKFKDGSHPGVYLDPSASVPVTVWWGRNLILMPPMSIEWSPDLLDSVLCHERAHISRKDWWWNLAGLAACALAWPNPLVWILHRQSRDLSEMAADDRVIRAGVPASRYAQDLLNVAMQCRGQVRSLALPMAVRTQISRRIDMLLNPRQVRGGTSLIVIATIASAQLLGAIVLCNWSLIQKKAVPPKMSSALPRARDTRIEVKWYLVDAGDPVGVQRADEGLTIRQLDNADVESELKARHAELIEATCPLFLSQMAHGRGIESAPIDVKRMYTHLQPVPLRPYTEQVDLFDDMIHVKLDVVPSGSKSHKMYRSTFSQGPDTVGSVIRDGRPLCFLGPEVDSRRVFIVNRFYVDSTKR